MSKSKRPSTVAKPDKITKRMPAISHWNYRMVRALVVDTEDPTFEIREVYYGDREETQIIGWTTAQSPFGNSPRQLCLDLKHMAQARHRAVLIAVLLPDGREHLRPIALDENWGTADDGRWPTR